jgi:hypothetical protein
MSPSGMRSMVASVSPTSVMLAYANPRLIRTAKFMPSSS